MVEGDFIVKSQYDKTRHAYYLAHKSEFIQRATLWRKSNVDRYKELQRLSYDRHKDTRYAKTREYNKKNLIRGAKYIGVTTCSKCRRHGYLIEHYVRNNKTGHITKPYYYVMHIKNHIHIGSCYIGTDYNG